MRTLLLVAIMFVIAILDQTTKAAVMHSLDSPRSYLGGHLMLLRAENSGAFLSLGAALPEGVRILIFSGVVAVGLSIAAYVLLAGKMQTRSDEIALAMIIAGGFGNLIDRVRFHGRVTDFLYLQAGPLHTGVFNVADMAITGGVVWLMLSWMITKKTAPAT
jgi:signal peptidase II